MTTVIGICGRCQPTGEGERRPVVILAAGPRCIQCLNASEHVWAAAGAMAEAIYADILDTDVTK